MTKTQLVVINYEMLPLRSKIEGLWLVAAFNKTTFKSSLHIVYRLSN